ncbi:MAG: helix-turn-helix domain-containing protein [Hyphomonadaceae bacterium]
MKLREVLAKNLRRVRHERGLSQEALADEAGIDRTYVSALERSVYAATVDMIEKLAGVLDTEPADLLTNRKRPRA